MRYRWQTTPYKHQVVAVKKLLSTGWGGALLLEPRTGKTKTLIDYMAILHQAGKVNRVLILAPNSVLGVWEDELAMHCPFEYRLVIWDRDGRKTTPLPTEPDILNIVVMNYDAFSIPDRRSKMGRMALRDAFREWAPDLMALDESHRIKSPSAKKTYAVWSVAWEFDRKKQPTRALVPYRVIMTGTPVTKKRRVFDIYSQWKFLNPERFADLPTYQEFKHHYGIWIQKQGYELWKRNINVDELRGRIAEDAVQIRRADCFELPPRRSQVIPVELTERTQQVYDDMLDDMLAKLSDSEVTTASIKLVQGLRLAQITSGLAKTPEGKLYAVGSEKLDILSDLLDDLFAAEEKVVICARFRGDLHRIAKLLSTKKAKHWRVQGGVKRQDRDNAIRAFRSYSGPAAFVAQPQTVSQGVDLSTASVMIWYSLVESFLDYDQMCDRIALSRRETTFYHLLARGTIDEKQHANLREDKDLADLMLRDLRRSS